MSVRNDRISLSGPTSVGEEVVAPARKTQRTRAPQLCRSCLRCRAKKIKCSGERPKCSTCAALDHPCSYREDARKAGGSVKGVVLNLQKEIAALRRMVSEYQHSSAHSTASNLVQWSAESEAQPEIQPNDLSIGCDSRHPDGVDTDITVDYDVAADTEGPPSPKQILPREHVQLSEQPNSTPEQAHHVVHGPSPSEALVAGAFSQNGKVTVHGVTSTLHQQSGGAETAHYDQGLTSRDEAARHRLISYAAVQKQKESFTFTSANCALDLDGLPPETAKHLLDIHWSRQHFTYLLTYRPAIMDSLVTGGPYCNKLLLNAIYYTSCQYSDRVSLRSDPESPQSIGSRFYRRFKELLVDHIDEPSIPTAIALLLCGQCLVAYGRPGGGWVLCGAAYRMLTELGCHLTIQDRASRDSLEILIESEVRKRLYWGAFVIDKFQSLYLGRAPALRTSEARASKDLFDTYEEYESWFAYLDPESKEFEPEVALYEPIPAYGVSSFSALIQLAEIATELVEALYSLESTRIQSETAWAKRCDILLKLDNWQKTLPPHLSYKSDAKSCPPPHQLNLHITFSTLIILCGHPFLSNGHLGALVDLESQMAVEEQCTSAALSIWSLIKLYKMTFTLRRAPYIMCFAAYHAVLILLHSRQAQVHFTDCIPYLWSALLDLKHGSHAALTEPLQRLKKRLALHALIPAPVGENSSIDQSAMEAELMEGEDANGNIHSILGTDFLQNVNCSAWNTPSWLDKAVGDQLLQEDSIFGLTGTIPL